MRLSGGEYPVRRAAQRLSFGSLTIRENFGDKNPYNGALPDGVCGNERENTYRHQSVMPRKERPRDQSERCDVSERSDEQKRPATAPINEPQPDKCKDQIGHADPYRL